MVVVVNREDVDLIKEILIANGEEVFEIGELV
jgi:phosphoribosylaminoimidazole (AIR) synthetase